MYFFFFDYIITNSINKMSSILDECNINTVILSNDIYNYNNYLNLSYKYYFKGKENSYSQLQKYNKD